MKLLILVVGILINNQGLKAKSVWLDYDIGLGKKFKDIDDAYALIHLLRSPSINVIGVSTVFGNTNDLDHQVKYTNKILSKFKNKSINVFKGAKKPGQYENAATRALVENLETKQFHIIAAGRLTNIAGVLRKRPDLKKNIKSIIINAGRRLEYAPTFGKNKIIFPDTNVDGDINAIREILNHDINLVMIPTESMTEILITRENLSFLKKQSPVLKWIANRSITWLNIWRIFPGAKGFIPWDLWLSAYITNPESYSCDFNVPTEIKKLKDTTHSLFKLKKREKKKEFLVNSYALKSDLLATYCYKISKSLKTEIFSKWIDN